jgi:hypothetical protein
VLAVVDLSDRPQQVSIVAIECNIAVSCDIEAFFGVSLTGTPTPTGVDE